MDDKKALQEANLAFESRKKSSGGIYMILLFAIFFMGISMSAAYFLSTF